MWNPHLSPAIVDIQNYNSKIKEYYLEQQQQYFDKLYNEILNEDKTHSFKDYFMIETLFNNNGKFRNNISKIFHHEMKKLDGKKVEIISKLRTEHIALNGYAKKILNKPSDRCPDCHTIETVKHFMMDCEKFKKERDEMRLKLIKVNHEFNHEQFFDIKNILFPHLWVELPDPEEKENYKEKWNEATNTRVKILQIVIDYFNETNRFNQDEII